MVDSMNAYWKVNPPLHLMVAAYLGVGSKSSKNDPIENVSEFVPVNALPASEFDQILASHGLPIMPTG